MKPPLPIHRVTDAIDVLFDRECNRDDAVTSDRFLGDLDEFWDVAYGLRGQPWGAAVSHLRPIHTEEALLTRRELAERLGVCEDTLDKRSR